MLSGNLLLGAANGESEIGRRGRAWEHPSTVRVRVLSSSDLGVVGLGDGGGEVDERSSGIADSINAGLGLRAVANGVAGGGELPEALCCIDVHVGDVAGVLGLVDETKVVGTGGVILERDSEEWGSEVGLDGVKEGLLLGWLDGVECAEGQAEQTVGVGVTLELRRDRGGGLNGL